MTGNKTVARPYAKAIFEIALKDNTLIVWSKALRLLTQIATAQSLQRVYGDPRFSPKELSHIFIEIAKKTGLMTTEIENFILVLADSRRLVLLPLIASLYEENKAEQEKTIQVKISTPFELRENTLIALQQALKKRIQREVNLKVIKNTDLIGGIIISANDMVINYSVTHLLSQLKNHLMAGLSH